MSVLADLTAALSSGSVEVIDLTAAPECARWVAEESPLRNRGALPPIGAVVVAAPLRIVGGSGSPVRVLALVER